MALKAKIEMSQVAMPKVVIDEEAITRWITARLNDGRNTFIRNVSRGGGGGRTYKRRSVTHQASRPGEYPATDTGRLVNSVDFRMETPTSGVLYSDIDYADYLAHGTKRMAPRKMLTDALNEALEARPATDVLAQAAKLTGET